MKDFVKFNNEMFYAANKQVGSLLGRVGIFSGLTNSYLSFLQHKRNRIDGWAVMWWAYSKASGELKNQEGDLAARKQRVAEIFNTLQLELQQIHDRFEEPGTFSNYDFWLKVESWTDDMVSNNVDRIISGKTPEQEKLRQAFLGFWAKFLETNPEEFQMLNTNFQEFQDRVNEIMGFG